MRPAASLRRNALAHYGGQIVAAALAFALAPWYVRHVGLEVWGLVGLLALFSAWLNLLDVGLTPAITRALAALPSSGAEGARKAGGLVRSVEWIYASVLAIAVALVALAAPWLASAWLRLERLPVAEAAQSIVWIALAVGLRLHENVYRAVLSGFEHMVLLNALSVFFSVLRWGGGLVLVASIEPPAAVALFAWQAGIAALSLLAFAVAARLEMRGRVGALRARWQPLWEMRHFAGGLAASSLFGLLLTQVDKIVLSKLLPLAEFGRYVLAATLADLLALLASPLYAVLLPRFARLHAAGDAGGLRALYLASTQHLGTVLLPTGLLLVLCAPAVIELWSGDAALAASMAPLVSLLALGRVLNASMQLPAALQTASGWTSLGAALNLVAMLVLLPAILITVPTGGAMAYAWCWLVLNIGYVFVGTALMHRRLLPGSWTAWFRGALLVPAAVAVLPIGLVAGLGGSGSRLATGALLVIALAVALVACACAQPASRRLLKERFGG